MNTAKWPEDKLYWTLEERLELASRLVPELSAEDQLQWATAGMVKTKKGYIEFSSWSVLLKANRI